MRKLLMFLGILYPLICSGEWWITTVDTLVLGGSSIAIDSLGIPHIAYTKCNRSHKWFFNYRSWNPIDSSWTLEFTHDSSTFPKLKLDSKGLPHIVSDQCWYIWKDTNDVWNKENVWYEIGSGWYHHGYSLALDTNDYPHVLGVYRGCGDSLHPYYARLFYWNKDSIGWHYEEVDTVSNYTHRTPIIIDNENVIHIAYPSLTSYLCYAKKNGGVWDKEAVPGTGTSPSLALDTSGFPCITWIHSKKLWFARKDSNKWELEVVDTTYSCEPVLCIDENNNPRIAYLCKETDTTWYWDLRYAWFDGISWNITILEKDIASKKLKDKIHATFIDMEIDRYGNSHICYDHQRDLENGYEKYAVGHGFAGVEESEEFRVKSLELKVYPNPFIQWTDVRCQMPDVRIQVYDMMGRLIEERSKKQEARIGKNLPAGIYFVKLKNYNPVKIIKMGGVK